MIKLNKWNCISPEVYVKRDAQIVIIMLLLYCWMNKKKKEKKRKVVQQLQSQ